MRGPAAAVMLASSLPALADERVIAETAILGPEDHAHLFTEICLAPDRFDALAASPHFEPERGNRFATADGLASYELTDTTCTLGLAPGGAGFGTRFEDALAAHIREAAPDAATEPLATGRAWTWEADAAAHRAEFRASEDRYTLTHIIR